MSLVTTISIVISALIAWLVCRAAYPIAERFDILDYPDAAGGRKRHSHTTPLVGGLAVLAALVPTAAWVIGNSAERTPLIVIVAVTLLFGILGFLDDRRHMRPMLRLLIATGVSAGAIYLVPNLSVTFLHFSFLPFSLFIDGWAAIFSIICIVGLQNAVNMADGKNGLVIGMCLIWTVLILLYAPADLYPVLAAVAGGLFVTFVFNLNGKLFLGDAGSYSLSVLVGLLAIYVYNQNFTVLTADIIMLWFLVPIMDCIRLIVSRVLRGRSPFHPDRDHLHHYLAASMTWHWGLIFYLSLVSVPAIVAFLYPFSAPVLLVGVAGVYVVTCLVAGSRLAERATV